MSDLHIPPDASAAEQLAHWFGSAPGRYVLAWEQAQLDVALADLFGFHALQLGLPQLDALRANRMPHRWLALEQPPIVGGVATRAAVECGEAEAGATPRMSSLACEFDALPFADRSIDLVVLPHTLELAHDAHQTLAEVERVLMPEGKVAIVGFNPISLWGLRQTLGGLRRGPTFLPRDGAFIHQRRLRDWLRLLSFEIEDGRFGCYRPPLRTARWLDRYAWMDRVGDQWWPPLGSLYYLVATKRVRGMRVIGLAQRRRAAPQPAPAVVARNPRQRAHAPAEPALMDGER